jgi:AraC family transcriptional regulator of adaptative response/methylated-DNA-[protein]-cysteine methyltransferase
VRFFVSAAEALAAGFRPCLRCSPATESRSPLDKLRTYIEANSDRAILLEELGRIAGMSQFTVQRLFKREMGVSPLGYQRALRAGALRHALKQGGTVTNAIYEAGYSSASRAYEGGQMGMTPGRFAQGGKGEKIGYASARTAFGWMVVAATERGLCWLSLAATRAEVEASLRAEFPAAELRRDPSLVRWVEAAVECVSSGTAPVQKSTAPQALDLRGTAFQLRVWQALMQIPRGETRSYSQLARELGDAKATRAVARACATNRVALIVPCHRVVGASGALTGYRWGVDRKRQLLQAEKK